VSTLLSSHLSSSLSLLFSPFHPTPSPSPLPPLSSVFSSRLPQLSSVSFFCLPPLSFLPSHSSSPTVLAYFSGTLFISALIMSSYQTFTIPANLSAITQQQTLAVGTVQLNSLSPVPQSIRDIAVIASELQPLPGKLPYTHT